VGLCSKVGVKHVHFVNGRSNVDGKCLYCLLLLYILFTVQIWKKVQVFMRKLLVMVG
jgi:hypothetical protein